MTTANLIDRATTDLADLDIHADAPTALADINPVLAIGAVDVVFAVMQANVDFNNAVASIFS